MATIEDERLKRWSGVGDAMDAMDRQAATVRMNNFCANCQGVPGAIAKLDEFKKMINKKYDEQVKTINTQTKNMNPLQQRKESMEVMESVEWWRANELYWFLARWAEEFKMFPRFAPERTEGEEGKPAPGEPLVEE